MKVKVAYLVFCILFVAPFALAQDQTKPNVVVMMVDNLGWGELGVYGGGDLRGGVRPHHVSTDSHRRV